MAIGSLFFESALRKPVFQSFREDFGEFARMEMPTPKQEDWKYVDASAIDYGSLSPLGTAFSPVVEAHNVEVSKTPASFQWRPADKLEAAIKAFSLSHSRYSVAAGRAAVMRTSVSPVSSACTTTAVDLAPGSVLDYYEDLHSPGGSRFFYGHKMVFRLGAGSRLNYYPVQRFGDGAVSLVSRDFHVGDSARVDIVAAELGGSFSRSKTSQYFEGPESSAGLHKVLFYGSGVQRFDLTANVFHQAPGTTSDVVVKGALSGSSSRVFRGLISIAKGAPKTTSFLHDRVLHLSRGVSSNSIPSLRIDNNDVAASHATSVTRLDDESLFYLRSRGITRRDAVRLAVEGFANDMVRPIPDVGVRDAVARIIDAKLIV